MKRILAITGAAGAKSGLAFTKRVIEHNDTIKSMFPDGVKLLIRKPEKLKCLETKIENCEMCIGDLSDFDYVADALVNVDTVIHIAGISYSPNVVKAAARCGVRRLILVHTTGIYSKYKQAGELYRNIDDEVYRICQTTGMKLTILRPTMIYGNLSDNNIVTFVKMVDRLPIMPVVNGANYKLQPVHYDDLAEAYYNVLINEESTSNTDFILSGGEEILLRDILIVIGKNLNKKVKFLNCPFFIAYSGAWFIYIMTLGHKDYREKVQRLCEPRTFSFEKAKEAFGYAPVTFHAGIVDEVREYLKSK